jgi:hypothetical protein
MRALLTTGLIVAFGLTPFPARSAPLKLTLSGSAFGVPINQTIDVTNGFSGMTIPLTNIPIGALPGGGTPTALGATPINSSFMVFAGLTGLNGDPALGANEAIAGSIQGSYDHSGGNPNLDGSVGGSGVASGLGLYPGTTAAMLPPWFQNLSAHVSGSVTGGGMNLLQTSLAIAPGSASGGSSTNVATDQQVPEPAAFATFALLLAAVAWLRRRARRD